jgi:hypothetical protein
MSEFRQIKARFNRHSTYWIELASALYQVRTTTRAPRGVASGGFLAVQH